MHGTWSGTIAGKEGQLKEGDDNKTRETKAEGDGSEGEEKNGANEGQEG
jgi:hypothetical protein